MTTMCSRNSFKFQDQKAGETNQDTSPQPWWMTLFKYNIMRRLSAKLATLVQVDLVLSHDSTRATNTVAIAP
jgi:hypothetical protein